MWKFPRKFSVEVSARIFHVESGTGLAHHFSFIATPMLRRSQRRAAGDVPLDQCESLLASFRRHGGLIFGAHNILSSFRLLQQYRPARSAIDCQTTDGLECFTLTYDDDQEQYIYQDPYNVAMPVGPVLAPSVRLLHTTRKCLEQYMPNVLMSIIELYVDGQERFSETSIKRNRELFAEIYDQPKSVLKRTKRDNDNLPTGHM